MRKLVWLFSVLVPAFGQNLTPTLLGGSGGESATALTVDRQGNTWLAGTTHSLDFPLINTQSPSPPASPLLFSNDGGSHWVNWHAFGKAKPTAIAFDPQQPSTFYLAFGAKLYRTRDRGESFTLIKDFGPNLIAIRDLAVDPFNSQRLTCQDLYSTSPRYKSEDGGATWNRFGPFRTPSTGAATMKFHPGKPMQVWMSSDASLFVSNDAGSTWNPVSYPHPVSVGFVQLHNLLFDPVDPNLMYGPGFYDTPTLNRSTNGGSNWTVLPAPAPFQAIANHPTLPNILYALDDSSRYFFRSSNAGQSWESFPFPEKGYGSRIFITSLTREYLQVGRYASTDGGRTWAFASLSRNLTEFALSSDGLSLAAADFTTNAFLARYPNGATTPDFATTFGGSGEDVVLSLRFTPLGDLWMFGSTTSADLPVTSDAIQPKLRGQRNAFLARFSPQGTLLYCSYFGSTASDQPQAMDVDSQGNLWITGSAFATDIVDSTPAPPSSVTSIFYGFPFLAKLESSGSKLLHFIYLGSGNSIQVRALRLDSRDNVILAGQGLGMDPLATPGTFTFPAPTGPPIPLTFVWKFNSAGNSQWIIYPSGSKLTQLRFDPPTQSISAIEIAPNNDILVAGHTPTIDFPTTPGSFQLTHKFGCTFPTYVMITAMNTYPRFIDDDFFLARFSPDGKQLLASTFLGGACYDYPTSLALAPDGSLLVTGFSNSPDFPQLNPQFPIPPQGTQQATLSILNPSWSALTLSTYIESANDLRIALTPDGKLRLAGTQSGKAVLYQ